MTAARCNWAACTAVAVAAMGRLLPGDPTVYGWEPLCAEHLAYYTTPGAIRAAQSNAAESGTPPQLTVIDYRAPQACASCGHGDLTHTEWHSCAAGCDCTAFIATAPAVTE